MAISFSEKVIAFNKQLNYQGDLPDNFRVMNPYLDNEETLLVMEQFYHKYYNDTDTRKFIIGINPGRYGAGVTGVPFTDTKRLDSICGIQMHSAQTHEVSSVFVYDMIAKYGGAFLFYKNFYINSLFPLAIIRKAKSGKWLNANYYDEASLFEMTEDFMIDALKKQIDFGLDTTEAFVLGVKNAKYVSKLNQKAGLFKRLIVLEHPRFIQQYRSKQRDQYIDSYISRLNS